MLDYPVFDFFVYFLEEQQICYIKKKYSQAYLWRKHVHHCLSQKSCLANHLWKSEWFYASSLENVISEVQANAEKKGDLFDFEGVMVIGTRKAGLIVIGYPIQLSVRFPDNFLKKMKKKASVFFFTLNGLLRNIYWLKMIQRSPILRKILVTTSLSRITSTFWILKQRITKDQD